MESTAGLKKSLTFQDLMAFGIASIMGSGGFNLIAEGVVQGGPLFPAAIAIVSALFQGASKVYSDAFQIFKSNTSESDIVHQEFGLGAEALTAVSILLFNIFSISTILVIAAKDAFPKGTWFGQISSAIALLGAMTAFSLKGIDVNKEAVTFFSAGVVVLLAFGSLVGLVEGFGPWGPDAGTWPSVLNKKHDFFQSILFFYFVLGGFDLLMKFVEETKEPEKDIPRSFYISNALSTLLTAGVAYAFVHVLTTKSFASVPLNNPLGLIVESALGPPTGSIVRWVALFLMIVTAFVSFLGTTRYIYGFAEDIQSGKRREVIPKWIGEWGAVLSEAKVPTNAVLLTFVVAAAGILMNHTPFLVRLSDFFLTVVMATVSLAAGSYRYKKTGTFPLIEALTAVGFCGLLATCCF